MTETAPRAAKSQYLGDFGLQRAGTLLASGQYTMPSIAAEEAAQSLGLGRFIERRMVEAPVPLPHVPFLRKRGLDRRKHGLGSAGPASRTIVIVDDEETLCEALKDILEEEGYSVEVADNGVEAMSLINRMPLPPCLVILDLAMPWMGGNAVYAALKADPTLANIPIIISTSDPSRAPRGVPVMKKPVDLVVLLETVRENC